MKHIVILAATLVIALSDQAFARLGQTEDQPSQRAFRKAD